MFEEYFVQRNLLKIYLGNHVVFLNPSPLFSHCVRVNPSMANRMVDSARSILNKYLPDVYIYTDVVKGTEAGK